MGSSLALRQDQNLKGKKKDSSSFLAKDSAIEKPWTLLSKTLPTLFSPL